MSSTKGRSSPVERAEPLSITITIGRDGRVHFHDLTADLLEIAGSLNPSDQEMARRLLASRRLSKDGS